MCEPYTIMSALALVNLLFAINLHIAWGQDYYVLGTLSDSRCDDIVIGPYHIGLLFNGIFEERMKAQILIDSYNRSFNVIMNYF